MNKRWILTALLLAQGSSLAQPIDDPWRATLTAINHAAVSKATLRHRCTLAQAVDGADSFGSLCARLATIPDAVLDDTALPYLKLHLSEDLARSASLFWSSSAGQLLRQKSIKEIESGVQDQLTPDERTAQRQRDRTNDGRALMRFASDQRQTMAVMRAMTRYLDHLPPASPAVPGNTDPAPGEQDERGTIRKARVFHILLKDRQAAEDVLARLHVQPDKDLLPAFADLARQSSIDVGTAAIGGNLGLVKQGDLEEALDRVFVALAPQTLSAPVKSSYGWHVLYLSDVNDQSVAAICQSAANALLARLPPSKRGPLTLGLASAALSPALMALMGEGWSAPVQDGAGNVRYMRASMAESPQMVDVTLHVEYPYARFDAERGVCKRSSRLDLKVNCDNQMVGVRSTRHFAGRAATGPAVSGEEFVADEPARARPGQVSADIANFACQLAGKKLTQLLP